MNQRTRSRSQRDPGPEEPLTARQAVDLVREYVTEMTGGEAVRMTSAAPTDAGGWVIEVEIVEDRRIPSSADMLALYEVEIDSSGEMLAYQRTRRYMRGQTVNGGGSE
ncbi:gas vesicle protein GvpO [Mycobacteriaceae bacterium 1482268.1]|nr:gas vesicle protein GvpO [Mycobacteriaceae bacterium 1482268.1]